MKVKVFSIRINAEELVRDQQLMNDFLETVNFKKSSIQFVETEDSYWSVLIHYEEKNNAQTVTPVDRKSFEDLSPKDQHLFFNLKQWRTQKAEQLQLKSYMICHNSELIDIALYKPSTLDELQQIKGFGDRKALNFGNDILGVLKAV